MRTLFVCAAIFVSTLQADEWTKQFQVKARPELRIDASDAAVVVRPGSANVIDARLTTKGWKIGPGDVRVTDRQSGDRVEIEIRMPREMFNLGSHSARLELTVPRELRADVHTGDGSINAQGLAGEVRLVAGDGQIEADSVDGSVEARTGDGSIRARGRFESLDVNTGDGSVRIEVAQGSKLAGPWRVHTGDGSVNIRLPRDLAANLDAHTGDGNLTVNVPVTTTGVHGGENTVRGRLNGGGPTLRVETGDGSIHIDPL